MADKKPLIPKSRTSSLLSMAAKVALKEGKSLLQRQAEKRIPKMMEQAEIIVDHVGQLKGAAMKAVQMITIEAQDFLPPEVIRVLEKLQSQAEPLPDDVMHKFLREELGEERFAQLENLSARSIASASIGQVYEATYKGELVVVKVQYPGIADSVATDLGILKKLVKSLLFVYGKDIDIEELFEEIHRILIMETNYEIEAQNLEEYRERFQQYDDYLVPKVYREMSTKKILTLEKMQGLEFAQWANTEPVASERDIVAEKLLQLYLRELFENQLVQTDPNPANFLVNSEQRLVLLDFGATIRYSDDFLTGYRSLLKTVFLGTDEEIMNKMVEVGFLKSRESYDTKMKFVEFLKLSLQPFDPSVQPFDFAGAEYTEVVREKAKEFTKQLKYSAPPKQIIFLHRKLGGIFQLLRRLEIRSDLTPFRDTLLN